MFTAFTVFMSMLSIVGSVTRAYYPNLKDADSALSVFVVQFMHPALGAVIYAALLAAMMSTVDSFLHVVGTVTVRDIYQRFLKNTEISDRKVTMITRAAVAIVGVLGFLFALRPPQLIQLFLFYASGVMAVAFFVPLVFGIYWPRATKQGAIVSAIIGPILS
jgi:sodium/pantothenate symporter